MRIKKSILSYLLAIIFIFTNIGCNEEYTPKPKDYPRINYPEKAYQLFSSDYCPMTFEYPKYAEIFRDSLFFNENPEHPCWLNIYYPQFDATIYLSYKELNTKYSINKLMEDAHKLTYKHAKRADYIEPEMIRTNHQVFGLVYEVTGDAASSTQFYVTDTVNHFMRGALYFNVTPNFDSLAPVVNFINQDISYMIQTLRWK